eukprot:SAG31_NODE_343_length_17426_cov_35.294443_15_plen_198_part_00
MLRAPVCGRQLAAADMLLWSEALGLLGKLQQSQNFQAGELSSAVDAQLARQLSAKRQRAVCEDCQQSRPSYGVPEPGSGQRRLRWCAPCARARHPEAQDLNHVRCEDCKAKAPRFGLPGQEQQQQLLLRWCATCAKNHPGAAPRHGVLCRDCNQVSPSYGTAPEYLRLWCAKCARASHPDAVQLSGRGGKRIKLEHI